MALDSSIQRIARLTPLGAILALVDAQVGAVEPRSSALGAALGATLAQDVVVSERPPQPIALRDGYAVEAAAIADASGYAPLPFVSPPPRIDAGDALPPGPDAVAPFDAVAVRADRAEAIAAVTPGEGVLPAGGDATARAPLRRAGERLRALDIAVMAAAGVTGVSVRSPRFLMARGSATATPIIASSMALLTDLLVKSGATALGAPGSLEDALADDQVDAVIAVGGTGSGRNDNAVRTLARLGHVEVHGIAIAPGDTAAFGFVGTRPVLLIPGRIDAALAVWLLLGRSIGARLAGGKIETASVALPLKRKVTSGIGLTELVPVRCADAVAEPLGSGYLSFAALARSDGFIVVPADSEGFAAGSHVAVTPWP
jgi:molybdopterin biosynthesis enzyme